MKDIVITAGHKNGTKGERTVAFATRSEALAALAKGECPKPWESFEQMFMDAVAHRTVEIQTEIRKSLDGGTSMTARKHLLDE